MPARNFASDNQRIIYESCAQSPKTVDMLLEVTNVSMSEAQQTLFELQIQGALEQDLAGRWCIT
jgi:predicted Rossmann fold nucleotide-binding protein DprA/Smf involved in DNA uptake